jgi:hypothetical protein
MLSPAFSRQPAGEPGPGGDVLLWLGGGVLLVLTVSAGLAIRNRRR